MKQLLGLAFLVWLSAGLASAKTATVYVSPNAKAAGDGSAGSPFNTLTQARDALRAGEGGGTVVLEAGTFYLPQTFVLTARDSGTADAPAVYEAQAGAKVVLSGGQKLRLAWKPYKNGIMQATTPPGLTFDQLFVNDNRQHMARYPNYDPNVLPYHGYAADAISPARAARWADPAGGFIHAMQTHLWGDMQYLITGKKPDNEVTYVGGWQNHRPTGMHKRYRYVENIFEELDAPGEWFHNSKTNTLYYYPPKGVNLRTATFEVSRLDHIVELDGSATGPVKYVIFKGITFRHANRTFMKTREPLLRSDWMIYRGGAVMLTGTEHCTIENCEFDQVGGNAVFVNDYNRRFTLRDSHIHGIGASGVCFVGDPNAVRNPCSEYRQSNTYDEIDKTPGPKTDNYPADCLVDDCLIHNIGLFEKQTAGVEISMSSRITVRHCSIYHTPRAGINIGDGCWGGHVIAFCDVFDTVLETGDHGCFNSWGRDRYWHLKGAPKDKLPELSKLDAVEQTVIRNSRWRCDHGWDIDLDDGSSNYHIYNNLCLHGGIKNREGFYRVDENNIMVNNTFHPHVWFANGEDVLRRNIVFRPYAPIRTLPPWGKEVDGNLLYAPGQTEPQPAVKLQAQSGRDKHSIVADAMFVDPASGDYQVKQGSPALKLGFQNFPMDQFGVTSPTLKAIARTPVLPAAETPADRPASARPRRGNRVHQWLGARIKNVAGMDEVSAGGLPGEAGVLVLSVPEGCPAAQAGLRPADAILTCNGKKVDTVDDLLRIYRAARGGKLKLGVSRNQSNMTIELSQ